MIKGTIPNECPRCDALQKFEPKMRVINSKSLIVDVFIRCGVCRYHKVLRKSTVEIENLRRMKITKKHAINALRNQGLEPVVLENQLEQIHNILMIKELELREELSNDS